MKKILLIISIVAVTLGCETYSDPEVEYASTFPISGEWWVTYQVETSPGENVDLLGGYVKLLTYNTASNNADSVWIDDDGHFWDFKCKTAVNMDALTFAAGEVPNVSYDSRVRIQNGKVLRDAGRSTSGVVTDSIYFEVLFDDDSSPYATTYKVSGVRRTGFLEDEH